METLSTPNKNKKRPSTKARLHTNTAISRKKIALKDPLNKSIDTHKSLSLQHHLVSRFSTFSQKNICEVQTKMASRYMCAQLSTSHKH